LLVKPGVLLFGDEFAHVAKAHARHRDAVRRRRRLLGHEGELGATMIGTKDVLEIDENENDDYGGEGGGFDYGGYDDDYSAGPTDVDDPNRSIHRSNVDFDAIGDVFTNAASGGGGFDVDDCDRHDDYDYDGYTNNDGRQTFEELCRAHLRKFAKSAEIYAAETQLTKRVGRWQMGLAPLLEVQEDRPEFDIHQVGRQILERIERGISVRKRTSTGEKRLDSSSTGGEERNNVVGFSTIVTKDCEEFEVCRVFLSTLMLCNCGNIAVQQGGDGDDVDLVDSFKIELLNSTFQPPMESLFAPIENTIHPKEKVESSNLGMIMRMEF
jgi:condensin-2 complex subunit H2